MSEVYTAIEATELTEVIEVTEVTKASKTRGRGWEGGRRCGMV